MSMYLDRLARVVPPLAPATAGPGAVRAVACTNATAAFRLDNDVLQFPGSTSPGSVGRALVRFHAEGNDIYVNFDTANSVVANSAALAGNTRCMRIPAGQERDFEMDPFMGSGGSPPGPVSGLWCSATTINGQSLTATLRYQVVSFASQGAPGAG